MCGDEYARMVIKQGTGLPTIPVSADHRNGDWLATDIYEGEFYQDTATGLVYQRNGSLITLASGDTSKQVWKAHITQGSTNAPVIIEVVENSMGVTITPAYSVIGAYTFDGFTDLLASTVDIQFFGCVAAGTSVRAQIFNDTKVLVNTYDATDTLANDILTGSVLPIARQVQVLTVTKYN